TKARASWLGPIHAPTPIASLRSPIPLPWSAQGIPNSKAPDPIPARVLPGAGIPPDNDWTTSPEKRNGMDSQFGIRRVHRSIPAATSNTPRLGHHAIECISLTHVWRQGCADRPEGAVDLACYRTHPRGCG